MALLAGHRLNHKSQYFGSGDPIQCASSYDLTVGLIIDMDGRNVTSPYRLKAGEMVQVVTRQVFQLPRNVTGHVTCKTSLTQQGIWALTVGIVDPGWDAPIATTLLNFSRVDYTVQTGDPFLRVSLFEHDEVEEKYLRRKPNDIDGYMKGLRKNAATLFPKTFLNADTIAIAAGDIAAGKMKGKTLLYLPVFALLFAFLQTFINVGPAWFPWWGGASVERVHQVEKELQTLRSELELLGARIED